MIARVIARRPMRYRAGADPSIDRPAHVRAASALVPWGDRLIVAQDDAAFLAIVDPSTGLAEVEAFGGPVRIFEERRGNKRDKPDLEAAFARGDHIVLIGSGGPLPARRVIVTWRPGSAPEVHDAPRFFEAIERVCPPPLNLEGACVFGGELWLAHRGGDHGAPDVIARWTADVIERAIAGGDVPPPRTETLALGAIDGVALHVTDLAVIDDRVWLAAAAEASTSYFDDGEIRGSAVGPYGEALAIVIGAERDKIEGLAPAPGGRLYACVDADDPDRPAPRAPRRRRP